VPYAAVAGGFARFTPGGFAVGVSVALLSSAIPYTPVTTHAPALAGVRALTIAQLTVSV
jgi:hypothetical protein